MQPLVLSAYAADLRHLLQYSDVRGLGQCDTPADWLLIERSLRARKEKSFDELLALRIAHDLLDRHLVELAPGDVAGS